MGYSDSFPTSLYALMFACFSIQKIWTHFVEGFFIISKKPIRHNKWTYFVTPSKSALNVVGICLCFRFLQIRLPLIDEI